MNLPMRGTERTISAKIKGLNLPHRVKKLLMGSTVIWYDAEPLSQDFDEALHFFFDTKTNTMGDLLLKKHLPDISSFINVPLHWGVEMELVYDKPNRGQEHRELYYFEFFGLLYPMHKKFIEERDRFFMLKNLEFLSVPDDNKNKKVYKTTKFTARVIGV